MAVTTNALVNFGMSIGRVLLAPLKASTHGLNV
jgi:hypothetical protein